MAKFHLLRVAAIRKETSESVSLTFEIPENLRETFQFVQGQYVTLQLAVDGEVLRRSYSICSSALEKKHFSIGVKKVENGKVSTYLNQEIKEGDTLEVMEPMGNFYTPLEADQSKTYCFFAAGSGITPILSLIKTTLAVEPSSKVVLFYGNKDQSRTMFKSDLDELAQTHGDRCKVNYIFSVEAAHDPIYQGRISGEKCAQLLAKEDLWQKEVEYFICGPQAMMEEIRGHLTEKGISKENIHIELFTTPVSTEKNKDTPGENSASQATRALVICDGEEVELSIQAGTSILEAALDAGIDAPFSCQGGACCTCRAKLTEGQVNMEINYALTDGEVEEGYILTCQSHPLTPRIVVDYDAS